MKLCCLFRYVWILNSLLSGSIKMNTSPLFLHCIIIHGVPRFDPAGGQCSSGLHVHHVLQKKDILNLKIQSYNSQNWSGFKITRSFSCIMMFCSVCAVSEDVSGDAGGLCLRSLVSPSSSLHVNDCVYHYTFWFYLISHAHV